MHEMMFARGVNLAETPVWQRRGVLVYKSLTKKEGHNPITGEDVVVDRSSVMAHDDLPLFSSDEGKEFLRKLIAVE
jgi:tRNA(His) guanylyltransferase